MGKNLYEVSDVKALINKIYDAIERNRDYLGELDGKSGDGDLGISMNNAFVAMKEICYTSADSDMSKLLFNMAKACNKAAPSTMGTLLSVGIMALSKNCKGKKFISDDEIIHFPRKFSEAIIERGKAQVGDKTIVDALVPYYENIEILFSQGLDIRTCFMKGAQVAKKAADNTKGMRAKTGRAKWLGERAAEYPDAGAVMFSIVANSFL